MADTKVILDDKQWRLFLRKASRRLNNAYKILKTGATIYGFKDIIDHFSNEESPKGKWAKRKASTQKYYAKKGWAGNKLLQLTGNLRKSLLPSSGRVEKRGRTGVLLFTSVPYAAKHNYGLGKTPKREFMWLSNKAADKIADLVLKEVIK